MKRKASTPLVTLPAKRRRLVPEVCISVTESMRERMALARPLAELAHREHQLRARREALGAGDATKPSLNSDVTLTSGTTTLLSEDENVSAASKLFDSGEFLVPSH